MIRGTRAPCGSDLAAAEGALLQVLEPIRPPSFRKEQKEGKTLPAAGFSRGSAEIRPSATEEASGIEAGMVMHMGIEKRYASRTHVTTPREPLKQLASQPASNDTP